MNAKMKLFSYNFIDTPIHRLSGLTKLICFLLLTSAVMFSYDIRVILGMMVLSVILMPNTLTMIACFSSKGLSLRS